MWKTNDLSALPTLITVVFGALAVGEGFYYNKAKKENEIKLSKKYNIEMEEKENDD